LVALSKLEAAVLLAAAGCCKGVILEELAVSESNESDADAKGWKSCRMNQMLMQDWWQQPKTCSLG